MLDVLNGEPAFAEKNSDPLILLFRTATSAPSIGVGVRHILELERDPGQMTPFEQQAFAYSLAENYIFEVLIPALLVKVDDALDAMPNGATAKDALRKSHIEVATAVAKQLYTLYSWLIDAKTQAQLKTGDYQKFFGEMLKKLRNDGFLDLLIKAVLASAKDVSNPDIKRVIGRGWKVLSEILAPLTISWGLSIRSGPLWICTGHGWWKPGRFR